MEAKQNSRITRKTIGGTVYVVESTASDTAKETAYFGIRTVDIPHESGVWRPPHKP